jgi:hypothetical protein
MSYDILIICLQERELQMWCPTPLPEGEQHHRKLRSYKYKPPTGRLLEAYESDSSVEADEDTDAEAGTDPDAGGAVKSRRRTRSTVGKKPASAVAVAISVVKAAEQKKKKKKKNRKRKVASPPAVVTPSIPMPCSQEIKSEEEEVESEKEKDEVVEELPVPEDRPTRRSESPATKSQRELVQKTSEEALRRGLEAQCTAAAAQARMPAMIKPQVFWLKTRFPP